jgi:Ca2+-binding EF-hand superfamily protein
MPRTSLPPFVTATIISLLVWAAPPTIVGDEPLGLKEAPVAARTPDEVFVKADINGDGTLTGKELRDVHEYDDFDLNGAVSHDEYVAMRDREKQLLAAVRTEREIEEAFRDRDRSEDDVLTGNEKTGYESLDVDRDGRITLREFRATTGSALRAKLTAAPAHGPRYKHLLSAKWNPRTIAELCRNYAILGLREHGNHAAGKFFRHGETGRRRLGDRDRHQQVVKEGRLKIVDNAP